MGKEKDYKNLPETSRPSSKGQGISAMLQLDPRGAPKMKPTEVEEMISIPVNVHTNLT